VRYTNGREEAAKLWGGKPRRVKPTIARSTPRRTLRAAADALTTGTIPTTPSRRDAARRASGAFCEYGCGVAPLTAFLRRDCPIGGTPSSTWQRRPSRSRAGASAHTQRRVQGAGPGTDLPLTASYDVITCLDVLEHVVNPLSSRASSAKVYEQRPTGFQVVRSDVARLEAGSRRARARQARDQRRSSPVRGRSVPRPGSLNSTLGVRGSASARTRVGRCQVDEGCYRQSGNLGR